ncbi:MAG: hypothetical protein IT558_00720 [Alphaproteobacteria bacterium]|nr:hypothetical protein [Alphaproteobacteria bacterium]
MATYNKIEGFVGYLGLAAVNCNTDTFKAYLSNATPSASADDVKADLAEITNQNGYTAPVDTQNTYAESGGTGTCATTDITITASGGSYGPFQYVAHYDDTHASDILIQWYDYGSALTVNTGESFTIDYGASFFTVA